ncbi:hypothetical protein RDWZM_004602 [Blomia tropicalis]|uniref:ADP-ribosylation factor-like protein 15 n=1 Tax=Blomia tropicalis TaxID=40697 RepID=A0A9Q0M414_BLOTA|nr:hypothetical protein RDWZM_004602 [Blomia tropicalis]
MSGVRNAFNCSFVACRTGLRKCWHFILCYRPHILTTYDQYHVLCLGLTGSGKSTLLAQLVGDNTNNIEPTNGFNIKTLPLNGMVLSIKELGGSERVQMFWANYYDGKHALMFVMNLTSTECNIDRSLDTLRMVLANPALRGRPCLVIGTHKDRPDARTKEQMEERLRDLMQDIRWAICCCSALDRHDIHQAMTTLTALIANQ